MKRTAWLAVGAIVLTAAILLSLIANNASRYDGTPSSVNIEYLKLHVDLAKAVLVGFGAALLGVLIPSVFAEARYAFERLRDSRTAYSEAKTSVDYLAVRLCALDLKAASIFVQRAHVKKHEAELYPELIVHLRRRGYQGSAEQWGDELYDRLAKAKKVLEDNAATWDNLSAAQRLALLAELRV